MPNILTLYQEDLTYEPLPFSRNIYNKYIYKTYAGKYCIKKTIKGKAEHYGTYPSLEEARKIRDQLIANNWDKTIIQEELDQQEKVKHYYHHITCNGRYYIIFNHQNQYSGQVKTIEEALYYRDITFDLDKEDMVKPNCLDLVTDNPYLDGLEVPLPDRLIKTFKETDYGTGYITEKGKQSYHVYYGDTYFCACPTYEMAYYMRQELNKVGWDKSKVEEIKANYPVWYTWLNNFWKFVVPAQGGKGWRVNLTPRNTGYEKPEYVYFYRVENALWERDLLVKYGFDEDLVTELADDTKNPYFDMEIPPYPQRKVRRIKEREPRTELFNQMFELIQSDEDYSQEEICEQCGLTSANFRTILLKEFDTNWAEFKLICESGENPNEVLEQKPLIYQPDTSVHIERYSQYKGNITYYPERKSKYAIYKWINSRGRGEYYGSYLTRELAEKIVKDLEKCNWDKSKLKQIQEKHNHTSMVNSKRWVYANKYKSSKTGETSIKSYSVRKKDETKKMHYFGTFKDKRVAELVRDLLILVDWNKDFLQTIREFSFYCISQLDHNWRCQGYGQ